MFIKKENGFTAVDIAVSVVIVTIFIALVGNFIVNINLNSADMERKSIATSYAVQEIEKIKSSGISIYENKGILTPYVVEADIRENGQFSGYHKTVTVRDYVLLKNDNTKQSNILKEVTVEISYKLANEEKNVTLKTYIAKE